MGGGEFGQPSAHACVQWTLNLQSVTMTEWLLDSFIHSITQAFVQWTVTYVAGCYHDGMVFGFIHSSIHSVTHAFFEWTVTYLEGLTMTEWLLDSFIHSITHAFVQWTVTLQDVTMNSFIQPFSHSCIRSVNNDFTEC